MIFVLSQVRFVSLPNKSQLRKLKFSEPSSGDLRKIRTLILQRRGLLLSPLHHDSRKLKLFRFITHNFLNEQSMLSPKPSAALGGDIRWKEPLDQLWHRFVSLLHLIQH